MRRELLAVARLMVQRTKTVARHGEVAAAALASQRIYSGEPVMKLYRKAFASVAAVAALAAAGLTAATPVSAGEKWEFGPESWLSVGAGMRASYIYNEDADDENDFTLNSARIFVNGQFTKVVGFTFNTEIDVDSDGDINDLRMMDAILRLEFSEAFNIYGGRMLAPSDRANLDGPYYLGTWEYPFVSAFPQIFQGRDNGAAAWGYVADGRLYYSAGLFAGCSEEDNACYTPNADSPLVAGRLTYNFWDKESGYYTSSDYYGEKEILAVGLVGQFQADAATNLLGEAGDFSGFNVDVLMQKKVLGSNVLTFEGAYYVFDGDVADVINVADGTSFFVLTSFLIDHKVGIGKFQPVFRYQEFDFNDGPDTTEWSIGTNYIIKGHDLRLSALYSELDDGTDTSDRFIAGLQLQW